MHHLHRVAAFGSAVEGPAAAAGADPRGEVAAAAAVGWEGKVVAKTAPQLLAVAPNACGLEAGQARLAGSYLAAPRWLRLTLAMEFRVMARSPGACSVGQFRLQGRRAVRAARLHPRHTGVSRP